MRPEFRGYGELHNRCLDTLADPARGGRWAIIKGVGIIVIKYSVLSPIYYLCTHFVLGHNYTLLTYSSMPQNIVNNSNIIDIGKSHFNYIW